MKSHSTGHREGRVALCGRVDNREREWVEWEETINVSSVVDGVSEVKAEETYSGPSASRVTLSGAISVKSWVTDWHILKGGYGSAVESENKILPGRMLLGRVEDME